MTDQLRRKANTLWAYAEIVGDYEFQHKNDFHRFTTFETEEGERYKVHKKNGEVVSISKEK